MKKETLYLDTSVMSAYCDERAMERQDAIGDGFTF